MGASEILGPVILLNHNILYDLCLEHLNVFRGRKHLVDDRELNMKAQIPRMSDKRTDNILSSYHVQLTNDMQWP